MIYLLSVALLVWLLGLTDERTALKQNNYKYYLYIAGTLVALVMGLRSQHTGSTDTWMYCRFFKGMSNYPSFWDYYNANLSESSFIFSEAGFYFFSWLISRITSQEQVLVFVTSAFITLSACRFIYKNTRDVPTGLLIYFCLGLFTFNMNGMRQAMAMSICLWNYEFVKQRKFIRFTLIILLAMLFHKTAICFSVVYFLPLLKEGKLNIFWYLCGMGVFLFSMDWFIETFNAFTGEDYLVENAAEGSGLTVLMIYVTCIILGLIMIDSLKKRHIRTAYLGVLAGFIIYISRFFFNMILERLSYYFFYFSMLLIPNLFDELEERERMVVKLLFGLGAIVLLWYRVRSGSFSNFRLFFSDIW